MRSARDGNGALAWPLLIEYLGLLDLAAETRRDIIEKAVLVESLLEAWRVEQIKKKSKAE